MNRRGPYGSCLGKVPFRALPGVGVSLQFSFCCCLNKGNRDRVITVTVTALARRQHVVQYQTVTRNQKAARQHRALMTVELVDDIHALVDEAECCRDALLS